MIWTCMSLILGWDNLFQNKVIIHDITIDNQYFDDIEWRVSWSCDHHIFIIKQCKAKKIKKQSLVYFSPQIIRNLVQKRHARRQQSKSIVTIVVLFWWASKVSLLYWQLLFSEGEVEGYHEKRLVHWNFRWRLLGFYWNKCEINTISENCCVGKMALQDYIITIIPCLTETFELYILLTILVFLATNSYLPLVIIQRGKEAFKKMTMV